MSSTNEPPIIDWEKLKSIIPVDIIDEVLLIFLQEIPLVQDELQQAWQQENKKQLREILHKLVGRCKYCCFMRLENSINSAQNAIKENNDLSPDYLLKIQKELVAVVKQLEVDNSRLIHK